MYEIYLISTNSQYSKPIYRPVKLIEKRWATFLLNLQFFQGFAQSRNNAFVSIGIFSKNIFNHDNRFLDDIIHFGVNQIQKFVDASLG